MQVAIVEHDKNINTNQSSRCPGFSSYKTIRPIPYSSRWHRDLLIQATLDPTIDEIDYIYSSAAISGSLSLSLTAKGSPFRVTALRDIDEPLRPLSDADGLLLTRSFVLAEPRASDARAVWATRNLTVQVGDRLRVLLAVADGGGRCISELVPCIRDQGSDPFEAILSLVCRGDLAIDLRHGLYPDVRVERSKRRTPVHPSS